MTLGMGGRPSGRAGWGWRIAVSVGLAWPGLLALPALAAQALERTQSAAIEHGERLVKVCANCHGPGGRSQSTDVPNLAGQNADYLREQMHRFVDGRRKNEFMSGMIKAMSEVERADVVAFLSAQTLERRPTPTGTDAAQLPHGKRYYESVCFRCHGPAAMGKGVVPRIAGQQTGYLVRNLKRYRDGTGERLEPQMAANTRQMTDADIAAVAAWLSTL
jgi:cytochrome c553